MDARTPIWPLIACQKTPGARLPAGRAGEARGASLRWRACLRSVRTAKQGSFWRKLLAFLGPGYLVAVGYMDPGNWATSLAGGSKFGTRC